MVHLRTIPGARYGRGVPPRPTIGQPAPSVELPVHGGHDENGRAQRWSLDEATAQGRAVVLIFHRHIH